MYLYGLLAKIRKRLLAVVHHTLVVVRISPTGHEFRIGFPEIRKIPGAHVLLENFYVLVSIRTSLSEKISLLK